MFRQKRTYIEKYQVYFSKHPNNFYNFLLLCYNFVKKILKTVYRLFLLVLYYIL